MRIRDKINKKKLSHYMFNDEEIVCMNKKYFNDNYISKDKIRKEIKKLEQMSLENDTFGKMRDYAILILKELLED